ncbi:conserved hypothetical protein [Ricinus communis]|uniref:Uncharacterized protein n=1 Tax=Ricinus communis TaxID=3988 RepID=B9T861_RICCO|nr:conserved hypothetical protein [Ricinus communis]
MRKSIGTLVGSNSKQSLVIVDVRSDGRARERKEYVVRTEYRAGTPGSLWGMGKEDQTAFFSAARKKNAAHNFARVHYTQLARPESHVLSISMWHLYRYGLRASEIKKAAGP